MSEKIFFQGEVMLLDWSETGKGGRKIVLQLDNEAPQHPFTGSRTKQGKTLGQRYMAVFVPIGDDEQPVEKTPSQMAFLLCQDPNFWEFLDERSFAKIDSEDAARAHICEGCGIKSRGELDTNAGARSAWLVQFYNPFLAHRKELEKVL